MEQEVSSRKYAFVCGLPRSGTSLLGRNIARMENCTGFKNTGVFEDEGQFLQDVYAVASEYGGSSRVGFDARAHRTENSDLLTATNVAKLKASWAEILGGGQGDLRGKDPRKPADDAVLTSRFS